MIPNKTLYNWFPFFKSLCIAALIFQIHPTLGAIVVTDIDGVQRSSFLIGKPIVISVTDLVPFSLVKLKLTSNNHQSENLYRVSANGSINLSQQEPIQGSYQGIDPEGPLWSMLPLNSPVTSPSLDIIIEVFSDADLLFQEKVVRKLRLSSQPSQIYKLKNSGFIGQLFLPEGNGPFPGVIVLGGGEGGISGASFTAAHLSAHGFASLAVAYFGLPGLPNGVNRIPIEYFIKAINNLKENSSVIPTKIGLMGGSRGGEAVLAIASKIDGLSAVVSNMGSPIPISGYDFQSGKEISPWTYKGKDFPFIANLVFGSDTFRTHPDGTRAYEFISSRDWKFLSHHRNSIQNSFIQVQNIDAPILFLGAGDDRLWPSTQLMSLAFEKVDQDPNRVHADEFYQYPSAGHVLGGIPGLPHPYTYFSFPGTSGLEFWEYGGDVEANVKARKNSYQKILTFLKQHLVP